jgi:hypothetical protein
MLKRDKKVQRDALSESRPGTNTRNACARDGVLLSFRCASQTLSMGPTLHQLEHLPDSDSDIHPTVGYHNGSRAAIPRQMAHLPAMSAVGLIPDGRCLSPWVSVYIT